MNTTPTPPESSSPDVLVRLRQTAADTYFGYPGNPPPPFRDQRPPLCTCKYCSGGIYIHQHPLPRIESTWEDGQDARWILDRESHEALDLAEHTILFIQPPDGILTRAQSNAIAEWHRRFNEFSIHLHVPDVPPQHLEILKHVFRLFNELFFCSSLADVELIWGDPVTVGCTSEHLACAFYDAKTYIIIAKRFLGDRFQLLLQTLLHEMIHVYLHRFTCNKNSCICWRQLTENTGHQGHGRAFMWLAKAIEESSTRFLDWKPEIWTAANVHEEMRRCARHPSLHDIAVCFPGALCKRMEDKGTQTD